MKSAVRTLVLRLFGALAVSVCIASVLSAASDGAAATVSTQFRAGDVFAGVANGEVFHFTQSGEYVETLDTGVSSYTTGCAFDSAGNLHVTTFDGGSVVRFDGPEDPHVLRQFAGGLNNPESIAFDLAGDAYVGDLSTTVRKYNGGGVLLDSFNVGDRVDWLDISADQRTLLFTEETGSIHRYDVVSEQRLADFAPTLPGSNAFALRILADGTVLVADREFVLRLDTSGNEIGRYDAPGEDTWFSLNVDPDGESFWAGNFGTGILYRFDIDDDSTFTQTLDTGTGGDRLYGVCIYGETITALEDTDGDALPDDWEINGYDWNSDGIIDVDLAALGADPNHKDIFVRVDWLEGGSGVGGHSHKPTDDELSRVVDAFAAAPVSNPDGTEGINLHYSFGQKITETSTNQAIGAYVQSGGNCDYTWTEFSSLKANNFDQAFLAISHYVIFGHHMPQNPCRNNSRSSGISRNQAYTDFTAGASDFFVAVADWEGWWNEQNTGIDDSQVRAGTFMHELGHNLGLGHGGVVLDPADPRPDDQKRVIGADGLNYKPNYLSVMNYSFQTRGLRTDGFLGIINDGLLDYSRFGPEVMGDLNEASLSESDGLMASDAVSGYGSRYYCQGSESEREINAMESAVDWNCTGGSGDTGQFDINKDGAFHTLRTNNDWAHLQFAGGAIGVSGVDPDLPDRTVVGDEQELTLDEDLEAGPISVVCSKTTDVGPTTFADVPAGMFYSRGVAFLEYNDITTGTSPTTFSPDDVVTRAQMATFLYRLLCEPYGSPVPAFVDVVSGSFYEDAVAWLAWEGITTGTSPTTFSPDDVVTRAQMAAFLYRLAGSPAGAPASPFVDVVPGSFYEDAVDWLAWVGITTGTSPTTFSPDDVVTRAQMATFLLRLVELT